MEDIQREGEIIINESKPSQIKGLLMAIIFGLVGAIFWVFTAQVTGYNLQPVIFLIGYMVSQGFVWNGKSELKKWGVVAAIVTTFCIILGKIILMIFSVTQFYGITFFEMVLILNYSQMMKTIVTTFSPLELIFYIIAIKFTYERSFDMPKNNSDYLLNGEMTKPMATPESEAK